MYFKSFSKNLLCSAFFLRSSYLVLHLHHLQNLPKFHSMEYKINSLDKNVDICWIWRIIGFTTNIGFWWIKNSIFLSATVEWKCFYEETLGHVWHLEYFHIYTEYSKSEKYPLANEAEGLPSLPYSFRLAKACQKCIRLPGY